MFKKMKFAMVLSMAAAAVSLHGNASAAAYTVYGASLQVFAQSTEESTAHMIQSSKGIMNNGPHPWCDNRMYIDFKDTALFATALANAVAGKPVNIIYDDAKPQRNMGGHQALRCKVLSIF